jgi:hypothetical protein
MKHNPIEFVPKMRHNIPEYFLFVECQVSDVLEKAPFQRPFNRGTSLAGILGILCQKKSW